MVCFKSSLINIFNDFAELVLSENDFSMDYDISEFQKIFEKMVEEEDIK